MTTQYRPLPVPLPLPLAPRGLPAALPPPLKKGIVETAAVGLSLLVAVWVVALAPVRVNVTEVSVMECTVVVVLFSVVEVLGATESVWVITSGPSAPARVSVMVVTRVVLVLVLVEALSLAASMMVT